MTARHTEAAFETVIEGCVDGMGSLAVARRLRKRDEAHIAAAVTGQLDVPGATA